jgi:hypothetical protein
MYQDTRICNVSDILFYFALSYCVCQNVMSNIMCTLKTSWLIQQNLYTKDNILSDTLDILVCVLVGMFHPIYKSQRPLGGQCHAPATFYPWERPGTHCTGGWVGPRASLDRWRKSLPPPTGTQSLDHPAHSQLLYQMSYPTCILVHSQILTIISVCAVWKSKHFLKDIEWHTDIFIPIIRGFGGYWVIHEYVSEDVYLQLFILCL